MKNKSYLILVLIIFATSKIFAQDVGDKFIVYFTDKSNSTYNTTQPEQFLSQRAIENRTRYNIAIDNYDLPINQDYINSVEQLGVKILNKSKWLNAVSVEIVTPNTNVITQIYSLSFVSSVDLVFVKSIKKVDNSTNEYKGDFENVNITDKNLADKYLYGEAMNQTEMINIQYLHNRGFDGKDMLIAVTDAGFYKVDEFTAFDSLWDNNQIIGTKDFVNLDSADIFNESTHGMAVLSTMGGNLSDLLVGTAPKANYFLIRTEDAGSEFPIEEFNWVVGVEFADSMGADVLNSSLGYTQFDLSSLSYQYSDLDGNTCLSTKGARIAARKGLLIVTSAGNEGNDPWKYIGAPGDADSVLTVGAVDASGKYASFSSLGPSSDGRIKPNVTCKGQTTTLVSWDGEVRYSNGTSFSSPIMAGAVSCLRQAFPEKNNIEIINAVEQSAHKYSNPDDKYGYGIPNFAIAHMILSNTPIVDIDDEKEINVYPNPFIDEINIFFEAQKDKVITINLVDSSGKTVASLEDQECIEGYNYFRFTDLEKLTQGTYYVQITYKRISISAKVIKVGKQ